MQSKSTSRTVFINPNFKNTHINPKFLITKPSSKIHINPAFLTKVKPSINNNDNVNQFTPVPALPVIPVLKNNTELLKQPTIIISSGAINNSQPKIISKSRTKLVRESSINKKLNLSKLNVLPPSVAKTSLIKIGTKKLIRKPSVLMSSKKFDTNKKVTNLVKINSPMTMKGKYKLIRRNVKPLSSISSKNQLKKQTFVSRYALSRIALKGNLCATKVLITRRELLKQSIGISLSQRKKLSVNKKLEMLNINGVLYKSTQNKLQKTDLNRKLNVKTKESDSNNGKRSIYIRGDKFVLDKSGLSLTRVAQLTQDKATLKRIDIGGLTYVAKSQNVFIRTDTHKTRNHLSLAKQKSINLLSRKLVKSNLPCPIFRKVGKCAAFERGRCPKVHSKNHVNICTKFLKGECNNEKCLLSHEITLSKMPTCKFFLQGCCVRDDCPYLHKKLNEKVEICSDFLKGFCQLAEKCNKRHEFACPDFERTGKCEKPKCPYCRRKEKNTVTTKLITKTSNNSSSPSSSNRSNNDSMNVNVRNEVTLRHNEDKQEGRYFMEDHKATYGNVSNSEKNMNDESLVENLILSSDNDDDSDVECSKVSNLLSRRPKLGELPAFIPL